MDNIWSFLLQTLSASLAAGLLLLLKWLLRDHLSPRWQYGVWSVLALRILIPVDVTRLIFLPLPLWVETWKAAAERLLPSAYSDIYAPISIKHVLPVFHGAPHSVTDYLLVIYALGVAAYLLWYLISYCRLRRFLRRGTPAPVELQGRIGAVCAKHGFKPCRTVIIGGLPSAFICGVIRPVLAVPAGTKIDEKILLHELLHLKYRDALQNILWCVLRALHWCNPFLQYVFDRIGNDMEALCDQRVLERLEGEERREYGAILLSMASERYARAPGTSSISNGGRNIARRIAAIVRFKKYPRGMALVSLCIILVLGCSTLLGTASAYGTEQFRPVAVSELDQAMAMARLNRCTTLAGALDTYAKGLILENGIYIATASPLSRHNELETQMRYNAEADDWVAYHLDSGRELEYIDRSYGYYIYNIAENADGSYSVLLAFDVSHFLNEDGEGWLCDDKGNACDGAVLVPVQVRYEDAWVVEEQGQRTLYPYASAIAPWSFEGSFPYLRQLTADCETGSVAINTCTLYHVNNTAQSGGNSFLSSGSFDESVKLDAGFEYAQVVTYDTYICAGYGEGGGPALSLGLQVTELDYADEEVAFPNISMSGDIDSFGSDSFGANWANRTIRAGWDGTVESGSVSSYYDIGSRLIALPAAYRVWLFWDGEPVEELTLEEVRD